MYNWQQSNVSVSPFDRHELTHVLYYLCTEGSIRPEGQDF